MRENECRLNQLCSVSGGEQGCSVLGWQGESVSRTAVKQAVLGQKAIQHRLFQAGAALRGEN